MELIEIACEPPENHDPIVLCIGKFDGVHIGHRKLLNSASETLESEDRLAVMSFSPHPIWALTGNPAYKKSLTPLNEKLRLLEALGVTRFYRVHFTVEYAKTDVDTFVFEHLTRLNIKRIVVGEGFNFGKPYDSGTDVLTQYCRQIGVPVTVVPVAGDDGEKISSTTIRRFVKEGAVDKIPPYLGRSYQLTGTAIHSETEPNDYILILESEHHDGVDDYILPDDGVYEMKVEGKLFTSAENFTPLSAKGCRVEGREDGYRLIFDRTVTEGFLHRQEIRVSFIRRIE